MPITAVAESPVTKIFAAVAGFFAVRRVAEVRVGMASSAVLSEDRAVTGTGGGRSGSLSISRHPHRRDLHRRGHLCHHDDRRRDFRPHHGRHRHHHGLDVGEIAAAKRVSRP